ncbi:hypothetical protein EB796_016867 [Bugula neritina]|uniref:Uncharacterized protein n=1 Tax=Bugula neritina TaxID=10212 RepID=A0A7J7JHG3_BUGNE|nr:hypothetical protein EB796_016867 [Bugula neritina]
MYLSSYSKQLHCAVIYHSIIVWSYNQQPANNNFNKICLEVIPVALFVRISDTRLRPVHFPVSPHRRRELSLSNNSFTIINYAESPTDRRLSLDFPLDFSTAANPSQLENEYNSVIDAYSPASTRQITPNAPPPGYNQVISQQRVDGHSRTAALDDLPTYDSVVQSHLSTEL